MKATKQIDIYLTQKRNVRLIDVVQYDTGIQFVFTVKDFTIPSGTTATLYVQKPSGRFVYQESGITVSGNTVTISLHNQAITEHGKVPYQVSLKSGSDVITTFAGVMMVEKSLKDAGATESNTVIAAFEAKTAEQIAQIEAAAQAEIAQIQNLHNTYATKNEAANAIKGKLSGAVVAADDVSPVEHELTVKARGVNLIPFPYYNKSGVVNGITYTINDDGSITAKGTATSNAAFYLTYGLSGIKGTVFMSGCPAGGSISASSGSGYSLRMNKVVNGVEVTGGTDIGDGNKIVLNGEPIRVYIVVLSGKTVDCTFRPMLNYGESAKGFVKSELTTVTVKRCGKNVLPLKTFTATPSSTTATVTNGVLNVNGYLVSHRVYAAGFVGKVLVISCNSTRSGEKGGGLAIEFRDASNNRLSGIYKQNELSPRFSFTVPSNTVEIVVFFYASGSADGTGKAEYKNVQLELGDTATAYEAYNGAEYIPAADGTVSGVTSISPNMTILTDTEGVIVECEYNRDTNKVIDKLINAITFLGGKV